MGEMVEQLPSLQFLSGCKVDKVTISGLGQTKPDVVLRELKVLENLETVEEVYIALEEIHRVLMSLDAFEAVDILIEESEKNKDRVSISMTASELGMIGINAGTYVQGSEGTVEATLNIRNYAGYAEKTSVSAEYGVSHSNTFSIYSSIPRVYGLPFQFDFKIQQASHDREKWSSFIERFRGGSISFTSDEGKNSLSYEYGWRRISDPSKKASKEIVQHLGDSMKSSLVYTFASTKTISYPRADTGLITSIEVGGLGINGFYDFIKGSLAAQFLMPITSGLEFYIEGNVGALLPAVSGHDINPCDRFYMGGLGYQGLRGFHQFGVGPMGTRRASTSTQGRKLDSLGGSTMASMLGAFRFDLPSRTLNALGIQGQVFFNIGTLGNFLDKGEGASIARKLKQSFRSSIGAGLLWPLKIGQLELNICRILSSNNADYPKNGFQFGITPY